jgi:hypothetical protein
MRSSPRWHAALHMPAPSMKHATTATEHRSTFHLIAAKTCSCCSGLDTLYMKYGKTAIHRCTLLQAAACCYNLPKPHHINAT